MELDGALQFESSTALLPGAPHIKHASLPPVENESLFPLELLEASCVARPPLLVPRDRVQCTMLASQPHLNLVMGLGAGWKVQH